MDKKEEIILEFMKDKDYVPMKAKEIAMILGVPKKEYNNFLKALDNLEIEFKIGKNRKNRYRVIEEEFLEGYSAPKNPELMRVFRDLELVEHLGTGIRRILKKYDK